MAWDENFIREGRTLRQWLADLLGPEPATRRRAENAVSAMYWGAPVADKTIHQHRSVDLQTHIGRWSAAVAETLADPSFPGIEFVQSAMVRIKADFDQRAEMFELEQRVLFDEPPTDSDLKKELMEKLKRLHAEEKSGKLPNSLGPYILQLVVENAGAMLLRLPELVRTSLRDPDCKRIFAKALANIGPPALAFVPDLFSEDRGVEFPEAVAAIAGDDRATVVRLLNIAKSHDQNLAWAASNVLDRIGPNAARLAPTAVDELLEVLGHSERLDLLGCIASMAPDRRDAFEAVIAAARPSPPQMRTEGGYTYDAVVHRRGVAIDALGHFTAFGEEAVPVLVEALDSFEEYDPDWGYENGSYGRIISALSRIGPAAAAVVPALLAHLRDSDGNVEWPIVRLLGRLGPSARSALPVLEELQADEKSRSLLGGGDPPCETLEPAAWAIYQISGSTGR